MSSTLIEPAARSRYAEHIRRLARLDTLYAVAVVVGGLLILATSIRQPYNQNELAQMGPYSSTDPEVIVSGTRQPPLDPLLGSLVQHLLGEGQLRQRLIPTIAGIVCLVGMALLLRRLQVGAAGVGALAVMATAPLLVRFSAYTRPYALPLALLVVFVYASYRWLEGGGRRWLVVTFAAAIAAPLARVPEPTVFLLTTAFVLAMSAHRGRFAWSRAAPVIGAALGSLAFVGYPMYRSLASSASDVWDPSPRGVADRFTSGLDELLTGFLPLLGDWMPWWPVTVAVGVAAVAMPASRRQLASWWFFWPLLAAPVAFALAYHFLSPVNFDVLPYRSRAAYFFIPAFVLMLAAVGAAVQQSAASRRRPLAVGGLLLALLLAGQLPTTWRVLAERDSPDFAAAADFVESRVPDGAVVLYDRPSPADDWHMGFQAPTRYLVSPDSLVEVTTVLRRPGSVPADAPVYLLVNGQCTSSGCDAEQVVWEQPVRGWEVAGVFDRFTLYAPVEGQSGRPGAARALQSLGEALGPELGFRETFAAAALLSVQGQDRRAETLVDAMYSAAEPSVAAAIRVKAAQADLDPTG